MAKQEAETATDYIYRDLRDRIAYGEIKPGTRLARRPLAATYGTSSIPVLEAIRRLERDGLVVSHPSWGTLVRTWSIEDIEAVYVVRESIEGHAARLFAQNATSVQHLQLKEHSDIYDHCAATGTQRDCSEADIALHQFIVECSGQWFLNHISQTCGIIAMALKSGLRPGESTGLMAGVHNQLITALRGGDPDLAERVMQQHIRTSRDKIKELAGVNADSVPKEPISAYMSTIFL